jgi:3D (Asp-Asp-Asp) domain-containing protein
MTRRNKLATHLVAAICVCVVFFPLTFANDSSPAHNPYRRAISSTTQPVGEIWTVTAYCPCEKCCGKWSKLGLGRKLPDGTKLQDALRAGCIAAPPEIPFGTQIRVDGYHGGKWVVVHDRGGAIKGKHIDLLFSTHADARRWGVKTIRLEMSR